MADPLSVAAAAAGFLSLAGQLADGLVKLKTLCDTIKNAPREVAELCDEMDMLHRLLEAAGSRAQQALPPGTEAGLMKDVFAHCEKMRFHTVAVLERLKAGLGGQKMTSLRFPFKKKDIEAMLLGVERGKTSLLLANQALDSGVAAHRHHLSSDEHKMLFDQNTQLNHQSTRIETIATSTKNEQTRGFAALSCEIADSTMSSKLQSNDIKTLQRETKEQISEKLSALRQESRIISTSVAGSEQQIQRIVMSVARTESDIGDLNDRLQSLTNQSLRPVRSRQIETKTRTTFSFHLVPLGYTVDHTTTEEEKESIVPKPAKTMLKIRLPGWFLQQQYDLLLQGATAGWRFHMSAQRIVPGGAIFTYCLVGNVDQVKMSLSTREFTVYDRNESGDTMLNLAIFFRNLEVCNLLVQRGILAQYTHNDYVKALDSLLFLMVDLEEHNRDFLHAIEPPGSNDKEWLMDYLEDLSSSQATRITMLSQPRPRDGAGKLLEFHDFILASYRSHDLAHLVDYLNKSLSDDSIFCEIQKDRKANGWITFAVAYELQRHKLRPTNQLDRIIRSCVRAGLNLNQRLEELPFEWQKWTRMFLNPGQTPFALLYNDWAMNEVGMGTPQRLWSSTRKQTDRQLQQWVTALFRAGVDLVAYGESELPMVRRVFQEQSEQTGLQMTLSTGPSPNDWYFIKPETQHEHHAYVFWRMLEGKPMIPTLAVGILQARLDMIQGQYLEVKVPGSWSSFGDDQTEQLDRLEYRLSRILDSRLDQMEQDLVSMTEEQFFDQYSYISDSASHWDGTDLWLPQFRLLRNYSQGTFEAKEES